MSNQQLQMRSTYTDAFALTPSDSTVIRATYGGLWVGGAGNVSVTTEDGNIALFTAVPAGTWLPIVAVRLRAATTATNILGMA